MLVALRLSRWHGLRTLGQPVLWVLHLAYGFVPLALATKAAWLLAEAPWAARWLHLQGAGALALMILTVMTRASLGHTGGEIVASRPTVLAYVLLASSALVRALRPVAGGDALAPLVLATLLWLSAFGPPSRCMRRSWSPPGGREAGLTMRGGWLPFAAPRQGRPPRLRAP